MLWASEQAELKIPHVCLLKHTPHIREGAMPMPQGWSMMSLIKLRSAHM